MNITIKEENQQLVATLEGDLNNMASTKADLGVKRCRAKGNGGQDSVSIIGA